MQIGSHTKWIWLTPAFSLLAVTFVGPIIWFIWQSLTELGSYSTVLAEFRNMTTSRAVQRAILNTNGIAFTVTGLTLLIGYPLSYALTKLRGLAFTFVLTCLILPYFTSVVVRTYAWMVLLGHDGIINRVLRGLGIVQVPLDLLYNRTGVVIGMTDVLLPYMAFTLYGAMKAVDRRLLQAAAGMGAAPLAIFMRVFLPLTMRGVTAGGLIVFILALGFFITPALMGGPSDLVIATLIEREIELSQNWPAAAVMTLILLAITLALYALYGRFQNRGLGALRT